MMDSPKIGNGLPVIGQGTDIGVSSLHMVGYLGKSYNSANGVPEEYCPACREKGKLKALKNFRINFEESIFLCEDLQCIYPLVSRSLTISYPEVNGCHASDKPRKRKKSVSSCKESPVLTNSKRTKSNTVVDSETQTGNGIRNEDIHGERSSDLPALPPSAQRSPLGPANCLEQETLEGDRADFAGEQGASAVDVTGTGRPSPSHQVDDCPPALEVPENSSTSLGTVPCVQWRNAYSLCWLDCILSALVHLGTLKTAVTELASREDSLFWKLFTKYNEASKLVCSSQPGGVQGGGGKKLPSEMLVKVDACLNEVRDDIFTRLQPQLHCTLGDMESPVFAFPLLLKIEPRIEKLFMYSFSWNFECSQCGHTYQNRCTKTLVTFTHVIPEWHPLNAAHFGPCNNCNSRSQVRSMALEKVPPLFMVHFVEGLPHGDLGRYAFHFEDFPYQVTSVIQYQANNHFITWILDVDGSWLECDDLKGPCSARREKCHVPASEIHIVIWERKASQTPDKATPSFTLGKLTDEHVFGDGDLVLPAFGPQDHVASSATSSAISASDGTSSVIQVSAEPSSSVSQVSAEPSSSVTQASAELSSVTWASDHLSSVAQTSAELSSLVAQASAEPSSVSQASAEPSSISQASAEPSSISQASAEPSSVSQASAEPSSISQASAELLSVTPASDGTSSVIQASAEPSSVSLTSGVSDPPAVPLDDAVDIRDHLLSSPQDSSDDVFSLTLEEIQANSGGFLSENLSVGDDRAVMRTSTLQLQEPLVESSVSALCTEGLLTDPPVGGSFPSQAVSTVTLPASTLPDGPVCGGHVVHQRQVGKAEGVEKTMPRGQFLLPETKTSKPEPCSPLQVSTRKKGPTAAESPVTTDRLGQNPAPKESPKKPFVGSWVKGLLSRGASFMPPCVSAQARGSVMDLQRSVKGARNFGGFKTKGLNQRNSGVSKKAQRPTSKPSPPPVGEPAPRAPVLDSLTARLPASVRDAASEGPMPPENTSPAGHPRHSSSGREHVSAASQGDPVSGQIHRLRLKLLKKLKAKKKKLAALMSSPQKGTHPNENLEVASHTGSPNDGDSIEHLLDELQRQIDNADNKGVGTTVPSSSPYGGQTQEEILAELLSPTTHVSPELAGQGEADFPYLEMGDDRVPTPPVPSDVSTAPTNTHLKQDHTYCSPTRKSPGASQADLVTGDSSVRTLNLESPMKTDIFDEFFPTSTLNSLANDPLDIPHFDEFLFESW
ncbi:SUMO-specific isopeptidase USPL1 [Rhynchocyon petersi]